MRGRVRVGLGFRGEGEDWRVQVGLAEAESSALLLVDDIPEAIGGEDEEGVSWREGDRRQLWRRRYTVPGEGSGLGSGSGSGSGSGGGGGEDGGEGEGVGGVGCLTA